MLGTSRLFERELVEILRQIQMVQRICRIELDGAAEMWFRGTESGLDFQRVSAEEVLRMSVPIHFTGENESDAGKASGVVIQHLVTELEIAALPVNLPEYLEVDLSELKPGDVAAFDGDQPHSYHNETVKNAIGFSVVTLAPLSSRA